MSARDHLERVRSVDCVVCRLFGMPQEGPTYAHHVESVRDDVSDYATASLCWYHHQGPEGVHGLSRRGFEMRYKIGNVDLIAMTIRLIDREG